MPQSYDLGPFTKPTEHYALLRATAEQCPPGVTALEFGVGSGQSTRILASLMPVIGFDSGEGLPEDWRPEFPKGSFAFPIPDIENVKIVQGWFDDTLPEFKTRKKVGLVHIDCDLYSSTKTVLEHIGGKLKPGVFVVFDEWHGYEGCEDHEQRAWKEFAAETNIDWEVIGHSHEAWSIRVV